MVALRSGVSRDVSVPEPDPEPAARGRRAGRIGGGRLDPRLGWFAAAALGLPPVLHLLSADLLTFVLLWAAAATLVRSTATLLDRLVVSAAALIGWTCVLGLVASEWPWGLHPVAMSEATALLLIVLRACQAPAPDRPGTPVRVRLREAVPVRDLTVLLSTGLVAVFLLHPVLGRGFTRRLATVVPAEDLGRHYALYDTILRLGGYASLHQTRAAGTLQLGMPTYPQGSHLTLAVVAEFLYSGDLTATATSRLSLFVVLYTLVAVGLAAAVLWAVQRAAGPALRGWWGLALGVPVAGYLAVTELPQILLNGFQSEMFALGLLAVLVGLAIRPLSRPREQIAVLALLTVAIAFSHYLLLPVTGLVVLGWAAVHHRGWRRERLFLLAAAGAAAVLAVFPIYVNLTFAGSADVLNVSGGIYPVSLHLLVPITVGAAAVLLTPAARANRSRRVALVALAAIVLLVLGIRQYQLATLGDTSYFYEKMLHQLVVIGLICLGSAVVPLVGRAAAQGSSASPLGRLRSGAAVATVTGCLLLALVMNSQPDATVLRKAGATWSGWQGSAGRALLRGENAREDVAERIAAIEASRPSVDDHVAVSLAGDRVNGDPTTEDWPSSTDNLWLGVLNRDQGRSWRAWGWGLRPRTAKEILDYAASSPVPVRFYLDNQALLGQVESLAAGAPHPRLEISMIRENQDRSLEVRSVTLP